MGWASAPGGCPGRRAGPRRSAGAWNQAVCTDSWPNLSWAFTWTRPGRKPSHRRCTRTLTDSGLRALIVNFHPTIAMIDARQGGCPRHAFRLFSPPARHDRVCRALPHLPDGLPQPALGGPLLPREPAMPMASAVFGRKYYDPKPGRFLGRDPIEEQGGMNLYAFVRKRPVNPVDRRLGQHPPAPCLARLFLAQTSLFPPLRPNTDRAGGQFDGERIYAALRPAGASPT